MNRSEQYQKVREYAIGGVREIPKFSKKNSYVSINWGISSMVEKIRKGVVRKYLTWWKNKRTVLRLKKISNIKKS